ncbi:LysE family transporter [Ahrensia sp. AH-315-G08]|nr:LysE family transporter [Ahrensia sp. AH-315-G08]
MTDQLFALAVFAIVSTASPGGATTLATASGAQFGFLRSLPLIAGIAISLACLVAISGTGLSAALVAVPSLRFIMKTAGTVYLLWLAFVILRAGPPDTANLTKRKPIGATAGAMLLTVNPKAWAMAVGVAGSFSGIAESPYVVAGIFAGVFAVAASLSLSFWTLAGSLVAQIIKSDWQWHLFNLVMAALLVASIIPFWL